MKKFVLFVLGLIFLIACASGYSIVISAPDSLPVGKPLVVTGTTTFGIGTPIDVVLYYQLTTSTEIQRNVVYIQSDRTFRTVFDTTGLPTGTYKVEVPANGDGESVTARVVQLIDRSEDISLSSPVTQNFKNTMYVAGTIKGDENSGVQLEVLGPEGIVIFGPKYINTNANGDFSADVPITKPGDYEISFTDASGYIGSRTVTILGATPVPASLTNTGTGTVYPTYSPVRTETPSQTPTTSIIPLTEIVASGIALYSLSRKK